MKNPLKVLGQQLKDRDPFAIMAVIIMVLFTASIVIALLTF
jgi:hypothetical protein